MDNKKLGGLVLGIVGIVAMTTGLPRGMAGGEGGGVGDGGNLIKLQFFLKARVLESTAGISTASRQIKEIFGPKWDLGKISEALAERNVSVETDAPSMEKLAADQSAGIKPIRLLKREWMSRINSGEELELPACLALLESIGINDQPRERCRAFYYSFPSTWLSVSGPSRGQPPSALLRDRLGEVLQTGLPGGCGADPIRTRDRGNRGFSVSQGASAVDLFTDHLLESKLTEESTGLRTLSARSWDAEGNFSRSMEFTISYRAWDLRIMEFRATESRRPNAWSSKTTSSVKCIRPGVPTEAKETKKSWVERRFSELADEVIEAGLFEGEETLIKLRMAGARGNIEARQGPLTDVYGHSVHAKVEDSGSGLPKRIVLDVDEWWNFLHQGQSVYPLVVHELTRSAGPNDDGLGFIFGNFLSSYHQVLPASWQRFFKPQADFQSDIRGWFEILLNSAPHLSQDCQLVERDTQSLSFARFDLVQGAKRISMKLAGPMRSSFSEGEWNRSLLRHEWGGRQEYSASKIAVLELSSENGAQLKLFLQFRDQSYPSTFASSDLIKLEARDRVGNEIRCR